MALARLRRHGEPGDLPVIIEKTSGLIADRLLATGHPGAGAPDLVSCGAAPAGSLGSEIRPG
jgi:hypothetical protein